MAEISERSYAVTNDPWDLITAGSQWRRAKKPGEAKRVIGEALSQIERDKIVDSRMVSTAHTVIGAAHADLDELTEAFKHAELARDISEYNKRDFYPYSLLARLYFASHDFTLGIEFFEAAMQRGASQEEKKTLQGRMFVMPFDRAALLAELLLERDPKTYDWAEAFIGRPATKQQN